ncbi:NAD(P)/FAD-dependent oxidoreductase [Hydrogenophaga sp. BPS33]|uniref:NAD(P)/FAD-dependent oxidoreductase n=1 Tax=Hydrogenophaga sp. BPS33 TaxID=2651974 RepID=UPI00135A16C5|nr:FAD-dependent oxidoreductase [Hydrogenophaga sp. BPS33]
MAASSSPSYRSTQALIVGGGIHGCSLALNLALRGVECVVIEKDYVARHASGVNGGGVRTLGRHLAEITLALKSAALWRDMDSLLDQPCGLRVSGNIRLAENEQDLEKLSRRVRELQSLGFWHERMVDPSELRSIAPAVSRHCLGGLYVAEDGFANPFTVTSAFRARAAAKGATFVEGTRVTGVDVQAGGWAVQTDTGAWRSRWLFNCAGGWSQQLAQRMGDPLPIRADGSMQIVTARMPAFLQPVVGSASRSVSIKQWPNGTVTIGGGHRAAVNLATGQSSIRPEKLSLAAASAAALFPCLRQAQAVRFWSGIEAFTPDGLPIIDRGSQEGAFHVTGFSAHGFQLAPIVGQLVARWAVEGTMPALLAPFSRTRFSRSSPATSSH